MNSKNIKRHLNAKLKDWLDSISDEEVKTLIRKNTIITGGAMVSLLTGEPVNDYDVYFRTKEACLAVARYYTDQWNKTHPDNRQAVVDTNENSSKISVFISSQGVVSESSPNPFEDGVSIKEKPEEPETNTEKPKYRPVFITSNAITLSDKIQVIVRFYGEVEQIHSNFDFVHCTCSWTSWDNQVQLPTKALECIINKELFYVGSKYPLCSIIRTRKYLERGYHINAGQYVKMAFQLNQLNLNDVETLKDQLLGVDSTYFEVLISAIHAKQLKNKEDNTIGEEVDTAYVIELINRIF